jgi:protein disulfide-isomerase A6
MYTKEEDGIIIAAIDATEHKESAKKFEIKGFPTIKYFPKGSTDAQDYDGGRSADLIASWVNDKRGRESPAQMAAEEAPLSCQQQQKVSTYLLHTK